VSDRHGSPVVVAGLGSSYRRDDAVGPLVAALAVAQCDGAIDVGPIEDPLDLLTRWDGAALAVVVDAVRSAGDVGRVWTLELSSAEDPSGASPRLGAPTSSHGIGLAGVLRLARAIGRAPRRVVVVAVEGKDFTHGEGLSPAVAASVPDAVRRITELVKEESSCA
jgi:hydrogenase maturation protease